MLIMRHIITNKQPPVTSGTNTFTNTLITVMRRMTLMVMPAVTPTS